MLCISNKWYLVCTVNILKMKYDRIENDSLKPKFMVLKYREWYNKHAV
jgi:hypothetical protein